jgi:hypothetical protein
VYAVTPAAFPVLFPILYYVTHTSLRYRHPIDPVVLLLTAIAAGALWGRGCSIFRRFRRIEGKIVAAAISMIV